MARSKICGFADLQKEKAKEARKSRTAPQKTKEGTASTVFPFTQCPSLIRLLFFFIPLRIYMLVAVVNIS